MFERRATPMAEGPVSKSSGSYPAGSKKPALPNLRAMSYDEGVAALSPGGQSVQMKPKAGAPSPTPTPGPDRAKAKSPGGGGKPKAEAKPGAGPRPIPNGADKPARGGPTLTSEIVKAMGWAKNPAYAPLVDKYMTGTGGTLTLDKGMIEAMRPVYMDMRESDVFMNAVSKLQRKGGGTAVVSFNLPAGNDVLGHFTMKMTNVKITMGRDRRWNAVGHGTMYDEWDFDAKKFGQRHIVAEGVTRTLAAMLAGGASFKVVTPPLLVHQSESSQVHQGEGPARF